MGQANAKAWLDDLLPLLNDADILGTEDLTTHRVPLDDAPDAYRMFQQKTDGAVKVVFDPTVPSSQHHEPQDQSQAQAPGSVSVGPGRTE